jgi:hypothetical protein
VVAQLGLRFMQNVVTWPTVGLTQLLHLFLERNELVGKFLGKDQYYSILMLPRGSLTKNFLRSL